MWHDEAGTLELLGHHRGHLGELAAQLAQREEDLGRRVLQHLLGEYG